MFERDQRANQILQCTFTSNNHFPLLTGSSQETKHVKEKLDDLVHWLAKLKDTLMSIHVDGDTKEMESRVQLAKFASRTRLPCQPKLIICRSCYDIEERSRQFLE
jgi:hypothetical protein